MRSLLSIFATGTLLAIGLAGNAQESETGSASHAGIDDDLFKSAGYIKQGQQNFRVWCGRCHGRDARGGKGPDLTDGNHRHVKTDIEILQVMVDGISGTGMPGFGAGFDEFMWPVVAYIRAEERARTRQAQPAAGNVARGYELFKKHKCASCHWTGREGGRLGTDLSRIAATTEYVRQSLTNPNSLIDGSYQPVQVVTHDGRVLAGRRLHENSYFVLFMDEKENLHSIAKADIEELILPHNSLMPSFSKELRPGDVEDLGAYIFSLQKERPK